MAVTEFALLRLIPPTMITDPTFLEQLAHVKETLEAASGHPFYLLGQIEDPTYMYIIGSWPSVEEHWKFIPSEANQRLLAMLKDFVEVSWMFHLGFPQGVLASSQESIQAMSEDENIAPSVERVLVEAPVVSIERYFISPQSGELGESYKGFIETFTKTEHHLKSYQATHHHFLGERAESESTGNAEAVLIAGWDSVAQQIGFAETPGFLEFAKIKNFIHTVEIKHAKKLKL
ncbi:MAG: hypothetical protein Q9163_002375 [Psora crenata]